VLGVYRRQALQQLPEGRKPDPEFGTFVYNATIAQLKNAQSLEIDLYPDR
jgi:hypothetical protein